MKSDDTKTETLQFKVTEQERKLIERCATEEGTTVSKYVRGAVLMSMVMDGKADRLSPGVRIRDANNSLVLSGTLVNLKLPVRYLRDNTGLVHVVWVLNAEEARQKMPGEDGGGILNNIRSMFGTTPATDDGNTPYDKLPAYKQ